MIDILETRIQSFQEQDGVAFEKRNLLDLAQRPQVRLLGPILNIQSNLCTETPHIYTLNIEASIVIYLLVFPILLWTQVGNHVLWIQPLVVYVFIGIYFVTKSLREPFGKSTTSHVVGLYLGNDIHQTARNIDKHYDALSRTELVLGKTFRAVPFS